MLMPMNFVVVSKKSHVRLFKSHHVSLYDDLSAINRDDITCVPDQNETDCIETHASRSWHLRMEQECETRKRKNKIHVTDRWDKYLQGAKMLFACGEAPVCAVW
jgi:hypothetical protein